MNNCCYLYLVPKTVAGHNCKYNNHKDKRVQRQAQTCDVIRLNVSVSRITIPLVQFKWKKLVINTFIANLPLVDSVVVPVEVVMVVAAGVMIIVVVLLLVVGVVSEIDVLFIVSIIVFK